MDDLYYRGQMPLRKIRIGDVVERYGEEYKVTSINFEDKKVWIRHKTMDIHINYELLRFDHKYAKRKQFREQLHNILEEGVEHTPRTK